MIHAGRTGLRKNPGRPGVGGGVAESNVDAQVDSGPGPDRRIWEAGVQPPPQG